MEEAGAEPADGPVQKQLPAAVQRPHAALRRHVPGLHLQQLDQQGPGPGAALHQELHLLQLHEPPHLPVHVLRPQLHLLHEHGVRDGPLGGAGHGGAEPQQHQQPERHRHVGHQLGHVVLGVSVRRPRLPVQRVPGHVQLQPGHPKTQVQTAPDVRVQRPAEPRVQPERLSVQQLTGLNPDPNQNRGGGIADYTPGKTTKLDQLQPLLPPPEKKTKQKKNKDHAGYTFTDELAQQFKDPAFMDCV